jgi:transcriptional regulator with XRE-family HTH domain
MDNALGRFIRARRELVTPADVGLPEGPRRRTPGLRREELALLAGISIDYLVRLEQGRDRHPSAQVLDALGRVLALDEETLAHLHELAVDRPRRRPARRRPERVRPSLARLVEDMPQPAFITGRHLDVLAANALAVALSPAFVPGRNVVRETFLGTCCYPEPDKVRADTAAALRASVGTDLDDPRLTELVGELSLKSPEFRRLWARQDVRNKTTGRKRYDNPLVGALELSYDTLEISGADGQLLVVYSAEPGSADEQALRLLATLVHSDREDGDERLAGLGDREGAGA